MVFRIHFILSKRKWCRSLLTCLDARGAGLMWLLPKWCDLCALPPAQCTEPGPPRPSKWRDKATSMREAWGWCGWVRWVISSTAGESISVIFLGSHLIGCFGSLITSGKLSWRYHWRCETKLRGLEMFITALSTTDRNGKSLKCPSRERLCKLKAGPLNGTFYV